MSDTFTTYLLNRLAQLGPSDPRLADAATIALTQGLKRSGTGIFSNRSLAVIKRISDAVGRPPRIVFTKPEEESAPSSKAQVGPTKPEPPPNNVVREGSLEPTIVAAPTSKKYIEAGEKLMGQASIDPDEL